MRTLKSSLCSVREKKQKIHFYSNIGWALAQRNRPHPEKALLISISELIWSLPP